MSVDILIRAIEVYGSDAQEIQAIEELAELIQAISYKRRGREDNIAEEIADVEIMLEQLKIINNCAWEVDYYKDEKLRRLSERVFKEGYYELSEL